jgi:ABC-type multidrug transport system ATPase subunit
MNLALDLCDRAIYMEKGRVVFEGTPEELLRKGDLIDTVFFGTGAKS